MTIRESAVDLPTDPGPVDTTPRRQRLNPLHEAAMRLAEFRFSRSRMRTRDIVGLLRCHGARAWRASQPQTRIRIDVLSPIGESAVRISLEAPLTDG
ncbi:hypothetical protein [Pararhizobium mangrovi]|uniref:Uncharacterized protein n=1 Tax=Pararhizobium mangrovi TaxID=2590452 RepID=A0A506UB91_9HYPH|nr:hypothetical protein [Pararhizobium mangrovi]TPW31200.1 hypothetical protein FJU11_03100 [Pararhizobium mangrovi]